VNKQQKLEEQMKIARVRIDAMTNRVPQPIEVVVKLEQLVDHAKKFGQLYVNVKAEDLIDMLAAVKGLAGAAKAAVPQIRHVRQALEAGGCVIAAQDHARVEKMLDAGLAGCGGGQ
jgi:hypothetical protein